MNRVRVRIAGRVQGVGFRYATQQAAMQLGLRGWVRNLTSGEVEAEFQGEEESVATMLDWCWQGPTVAKVKHVQVLHPTKDEISGDEFGIR